MSFFIPSFNNDFEYWELYHKVTFDGPNRKIIINPDETNINVERDIYSAWKEWTLLRDNSKYARALSTTGGDPLSGGATLGSYFFLLNGWKLFANQKIIGDIDIDGNIFQADGSNVFGFTEGVQLLRNTVSSLTTVVAPQVTISGSGLSAEELATINTILSMSYQTTSSLNTLTEINNQQTGSLESLLSLNKIQTASLDRIEQLNLQQTESLSIIEQLSLEQTASLEYLTQINLEQTSSLAQILVISNEQTGSLNEILDLSNQTTASLQQVVLNTDLILAGSGSAAGLTPQQAEQLLKIYEIMGLDPTKPLVVSPVARSVDGEISQSISKTGEVVTVTRIL